MMMMMMTEHEHEEVEQVQCHFSSYLCTYGTYSPEVKETKQNT